MNVSAQCLHSLDYISWSIEIYYIINCKDLTNHCMQGLVLPEALPLALFVYKAITIIPVCLHGKERSK